MGEYQSNSLPWQVYQLRQKLTQWWEWQISRVNIDLPELPGSSWLSRELVEKIGGFLFWVLLLLLVFGITKSIIPYIGQVKRVMSSVRVVGEDNSLNASRWWERSQKYLQESNYHDACLCLYYAMLQLLDERQLIPVQQSRTDGEYWQLVEGLPNPQSYQTLLLVHQSLCFGNIPATLKTWENCCQAYREISNYG